MKPPKRIRHKDWVPVPRASIDDLSKLIPSAWLLREVLSDLTKFDGQVEMSNVDLMVQAGLSLSAFKKARSQLMALNIIDVDTKNDAKRATVHTYRFIYWTDELRVEDDSMPDLPPETETINGIQIMKLASHPMFDTTPDLTGQRWPGRVGTT